MSLPNGVQQFNFSKVTSVQIQAAWSSHLTPVSFDTGVKLDVMDELFILCLYKDNGVYILYYSISPKHCVKQAWLKFSLITMSDLDRIQQVSDLYLSTFLEWLHCCHVCLVAAVKMPSQDKDLYPSNSLKASTHTPAPMVRLSVCVSICICMCFLKSLAPSFTAHSQTYTESPKEWFSWYKKCIYHLILFYCLSFNPEISTM